MATLAPYRAEGLDWFDGMAASAVASLRAAVAGRPAVDAGPGALVDDDLAYVNPWGFDPARIAVPVLLQHGERDRVAPSAHSRWLAAHSLPGQTWATRTE